MKPEELVEIIKCGETSKVQFKLDVNNAVSIAQEIAAFANSKGGIIIVGVEDKTGGIIGLDYQDIQRINNLLTTAAQELVKSPVVISTDTVNIDGKRLIVVEVPEGTDKPHMDKDGVVFIKNGSDKRRVNSKEELSRLLQNSGNMYAEERIIPHSSIADIDLMLFREFYEKKYKEDFNEADLARLFANLRLGEEGKLNTAGVLLFAKKPAVLLPQFFITAIWFWGNEITGLDYRSSDNITGSLGSLYSKGLDFIVSKLNRLQGDKSFNTIGDLEIPEVALKEVLVNALVHRDYFINDSIKLFVFEDRVEIRSPGRLPNNLTVEQIKLGIRRTRNNIIASLAPDLIDYRGAGSGILRVSQLTKDVEFINDTDGEQFTVIFKRKHPVK